MKEILVFTGSYSRPLLLGTGEIVPGSGKGIQVLRMNTETGELTPCSQYPEIPNPTYVTTDMNNEYLYAAHELKEYKGINCGGATAYKINKESGTITQLNTMIAGGTDSCHIVVDDTNKWVFVANYASGSVIVYPRNEDGSLGKPSCFMQHVGTGPDADRQECPHCHKVTIDKAHKRVFVNDLGTDEVMIYDMDWEKGQLIPYQGQCPKVEGGSGPRHTVFNEKGDKFYVVSEMASTVDVFGYDVETGATTHLQRISALPADFKGESIGAAIKFHPNFKFLYSSNRGNDTLATFKVDEKTGLLELIKNQPCDGVFPRDFDITSDGKWLVTCNQTSGTGAVYKVNAETGDLTKVWYTDDFPGATCVRFVEYDD